MKTKYINNDFFNSNKGNFFLQRGTKIGIAISLDDMFNNSDYDSSFIFPKGVVEDAIKMIHEEISSPVNGNLELIINDNDCQDTFFQEVCDYLAEDGVAFKTTSKCEGINSDQSVIVTLDQQYNSGTQSLIFAPYDNTRLGESDPLALAMYTAFKQNQFEVDDIACGKKGFRENEDGTISEIVPTEQEDAIDFSTDASFVTISLGTKDVDARKVAQSIENGLARFYYYLEKCDLGPDLIYRADAGEDLDMIADYFHTTKQDLQEINHLDNNESLTGAKAIVNPHIKEMNPFSDNFVFKIEKTNSKKY